MFNDTSIFERRNPQSKSFEFRVYFINLNTPSCFSFIMYGQWTMDIINSEILKRIFICNKPDGIPDILVWWHRSVTLLDIQRYTKATVVKKPFMVFGQGLRDIGQDMQTTQK